MTANSRGLGAVGTGGGESVVDRVQGRRYAEARQGFQMTVWVKERGRELGDVYFTAVRSFVRWTKFECIIHGLQGTLIFWRGRVVGREGSRLVESEQEIQRRGRPAQGGGWRLDGEEGQAGVAEDVPRTRENSHTPPPCAAVISPLVSVLRGFHFFAVILTSGRATSALFYTGFKNSNSGHFYEDFKFSFFRVVGSLLVFKYHYLNL